MVLCVCVSPYSPAVTTLSGTQPVANLLGWGRVCSASDYNCYPYFIVLHCIFYVFLLRSSCHLGILLQFGSRKHTFLIFASPWFNQLQSWCGNFPCHACWLISGGSLRHHVCAINSLVMNRMINETATVLSSSYIGIYSKVRYRETGQLLCWMLAELELNLSGSHSFNF